MISAELKNKIQDKLQGKFKKPVVIRGASSLSGGCINECCKLKTNIADFFVKFNSSSLYPGMFEAEAKGLQLLKSTKAIFIPEVISCGENAGQSFLILEFAEAGIRKKNFYEDFGKSLAKLHRHTNNFFGLDYDNYIGSLTQSNKQHCKWTNFFIEERLEKQIQIARDNSKIDEQTVKQFNNLYSCLNEIFPNDKPSLLHGDLWSGNYIASPDGSACIIDPAVYFGFREMDISMSKLFGGFSWEFYDSYNEEFPLEKGWENRIDLCNLYPLLVHVNLFGGGYLSQVKSILKKF